jgi:hypothetical protein
MALHRFARGYMYICIKKYNSYNIIFKVVKVGQREYNDNNNYKTGI